MKKRRGVKHSDNHPSAPAHPGRRRVWTLLAVATLLAIAAAAGLAARPSRPAPPTAEEILAKKEWTEAELTTELSRVFQFEADRTRRHELTLHLRRRMDAMPPADRRRIQAAAMSEAMRRNLEQFRVMNPEEQRQWLSRLDERAPAHLRRLVEAEGAISREQLRELASSEEAKGLVGEATRIIFEEMSAEERAELVPLFTKWLNMVKSI